MGDLQGVGTPDEQPPTVQRVKSFAIAKREITVSQFRLFADTTRYVTDAERGGGCRVMKDGAWSRDARSNWRNPPFTQTDEEPVICVSAADAGAYAAWLAQVTGGKYRLPTEAEWEYAARAGTESAWWWGASPTAGQANCEGCEGRTRPRTLEVGGYGKNAWGLFDTAGNVWEWTCSAYSPRLGGSETQCVNLKSENQIVMRGGSWATPVDRLRSSVRGYAAMSYASDNVGFRVVREY
jgi:formylglycine-generating enzyme required for sulfatase activity